MHHIPSMRGTGCQVHIPYKQVIPLPSWILHSSGKFYSLRKQGEGGGKSRNKTDGSDIPAKSTCFEIRQFRLLYPLQWKLRVLTTGPFCILNRHPSTSLSEHFLLQALRWGPEGCREGSSQTKANLADTPAELECEAGRRHGG